MLRLASSALRRTQGARMFTPSTTALHGKSDEFIANEMLDQMRPIQEIASNIGIPADVLEVSAVDRCHRPSHHALPFPSPLTPILCPPIPRLVPGATL